jgi:hypothetical protein
MRRAKSYLLWLSVGLIIVLISIVATRRSSPVTMLDNQVEVLSFKQSYGTNHVVYWGDQSEGKVRTRLDELGNHVGLDVARVDNSEFSTPSPSWLFAIVYHSRLPERDSVNWRAELSDASGTRYPLRLRGTSGSPKDGLFCSGWMMEPGSVPEGVCHLHVMRDKDLRVASIEVGPMVAWK